MNPIELFPLCEKAIAELDNLYRKTKDVRIKIRAQIVLLAAEKSLVAARIAEIVRKDEQTVRTWLRRYMAEGVEGLYDAPRTGAPAKVTDDYKELLVKAVRRRPRALGQPYSMWTLQRLADYMADQTGIRVEDETVRVRLREAGIVLSRPQHKISSPDPDYEVKKRRLKRQGTTCEKGMSSTMPTSST